MAEGGSGSFSVSAWRSELPEKVDFVRQNLDTFKELWQGGDGDGVKWFLRSIDSLGCDGGLTMSVDFTRGS